MIHLKLPRLLLISGTGRDSGKTLLACRIIGKLSPARMIIALKISPHRHNIEPGGRILVRDDHIYIHEETDPGTGKDSSRMLAAGARHSFLIWASEDNLVNAIREIINLIPENALLVCESGGLRKWVEPGLYLVVSRQDSSKGKPGTRNVVEFEHTWIHFDGQNFNFDTDRIGFQQNRWKIKSLHDTF